MGIAISKEEDAFGRLFGGRADRTLTLSARPTRTQKIVAYLMLLTGYAFWAEREGDVTKRAHHRANASDVLAW
jgi:hypothetical protein